MDIAPYKTGTGWRVKKEAESIQCSLVKSPVVFIEPIPRHKTELLMSKYPYQEWIGYLVGRISEKENFFVEDLGIPPHKEASGASAEAEPFHIPDKCIGVIHSHNGMGAFHSGIDQSYVDKNFPISITVSKKTGQEGLEFDAISYQTTPCGKNLTLSCQVKYVQPSPQFDTEAFMQEAVKDIEKGKRTVPITYKYATKPKALHQFNQRGYSTGRNGELMTQKEIDAHLKGIWRDDETL